MSPLYGRPLTRTRRSVSGDAMPSTSDGAEPPPLGLATTRPLPSIPTLQTSPAGISPRWVPEGSVTLSPASPSMVAEPAPTASATRTLGSADLGAGCPAGSPPGPALGVQLPLTTAAAPAATRPSAPQRASRRRGAPRSPPRDAKPELDPEVPLDVPELHRHAPEMVVEIVAVKQPPGAGIVGHHVRHEALHVSNHDGVLQDRAPEALPVHLEQPVEMPVQVHRVWHHAHVCHPQPDPLTLVDLDRGDAG